MIYWFKFNLFKILRAACLSEKFLRDVYNTMEKDGNINSIAQNPKLKFIKVAIFEN